jgi:hypothetical protein
MKSRASGLLDAQASMMSRLAWRPVIRVSDVLTTEQDASNRPRNSTITSNGRVEDPDSQSGA